MLLLLLLLLLLLIIIKLMLTCCLKEHPRPEYAAKCTQMEANPITGIMEPYFPQRQRTSRLVSGYAVIVLMVCVTSSFLLVASVPSLVRSIFNIFGGAEYLENG